MDVSNIATALVIAYGLPVVTAGEYCVTRRSYGIPHTEYCSGGCCGNGYNQYCCVNIGAIVGGIIGGIILLAIIISVICIYKQQNRPRRGVRPAHGPAVITTHQQGYGHMQQQYPPVNPGSGYTGNPAFPPPYPGQQQNAYGQTPNAPPPAQYN